MKIALVEAKPSRTDFKREFDYKFDFDQYKLCSDASVKRVLKRDVDIDISTEDYDWIILIGADCLKYFTTVTSITDYSGKRVDEKYLPVINPGMLAFKPEARPLWEESKTSILSYINGEAVEAVIDETIARGIQNTEEINEFLQAAIDYPCNYFGIDTETTALYPRNGYVLGISICYDEGNSGAYLDTNHFDEKTEELLKELVRRKRAIFWNAKFDIAMLEYHFDLKFWRYHDAMLLHYLIDENPGTHGLKQCALRHTKYGDYEKPMHKWIAEYKKQRGIKASDFCWEWIPFDVMKTYAAMDALVTVDLYQQYRKILGNNKLKWVFENLLMPGSRFLTDVQDNGVPFDTFRLLKAQEIMQKDLDDAIAELYKNDKVRKFEEIQGKEFNPNSTVQLRKLLFDTLGLNPTGVKTGTGADSTNAEVLEKLAEESEVPGLILTIRQKGKIKNTYLDKIVPALDSDSRLRTNFNLHSTTSGRLSSSGKLNMQQLPRDNPIVKGCIKAPEGRCIVEMDLTTAEVYIAAVLSQDEGLMDVFRRKENIHSSVAKEIYGLNCAVEEVDDLYPAERQATKAINFGIIYGAGPQRISDEVTAGTGKYFSVAEAKEVIEAYFKRFKKLKTWLNDNQKFILDNGFIYSQFGRKRRLPNVRSDDEGLKRHAVRSGLNFLVQSVSSDINLLGGIDTHNEVREQSIDAKIFALVHDSVLADVALEDVEVYQEVLNRNIQKDRGVSIPDCPIGTDFKVHNDYSMGKFMKEYGNQL